MGKKIGNNNKFVKMKKLLVIVLIVCMLGVGFGEVFFEEKFEDGWEDKWIASEAKENNGKLTDADGEGIKTSEDAHFYQYTRSFDEFSNKGKKLVFQYESRHPQNLDCGGGYLKLLPAGFDPKKYDGETKYNIMFGPDICGATKKTHLIFNYKDKNHLIKDTIPCESDTFSHVYTLILNPDQSFRVLIDNEEKKSGNLVENFDILPPKEIPDPEAKKPEDWVDEAKIPDPEDKKPEGYDDIPAQIPDPEAKKPEDWDDDLDGEWQAPMIDNPEYKGPWKPKLIDNPKYKGPWVHPKVPNPDYFEDDNIYAYDSIAAVAIEIWQVKSGTVFNDILVTDDEDLAKKRAEAIIAKRDEQKEAKKKEDEENKKKAEELAKKREEEKKKEEEQKKQEEAKEDADTKEDNKADDNEKEDTKEEKKADDKKDEL